MRLRLGSREEGTEGLPEMQGSPRLAPRGGFVPMRVSGCTSVKKRFKKGKPLLCERIGCKERATSVFAVCFHDGDLLLFLACDKHLDEIEAMERRARELVASTDDILSGGLKSFNDEVERLIRLSERTGPHKESKPDPLRHNLFKKRPSEDEIYGGR